MKTKNTSSLTLLQKEQLRLLWNAEYPKQLGHHSLQSFEDYLASLKYVEHHLILNNEEMIIAWYCDFQRDNERWFAMILNSNIQGRGIGTKLIHQAQQNNLKLSAWVIDHDNDMKEDGTTYKSPLEFYLKNGFNVIDEKRLELEKISAVKIEWNRQIR